ncbi:MAG: hotdog fold thioesterase [Deltaproteobacteria bacterium]|nr:MAG: hotdog fold thioesterase [Deltaproteobacteria bacterium]
MDAKAVAALRARVLDEPFAKMLGLHVIDIDDGYAVVEMVATEEMENIFQMIHGGAIFTLIDEAFELACNSHGTVAVALNVNVTYHRAPARASKVRAEAKEVARTRRTGSYHIIVKDEKENLIASCHALAYRKGDKLPFMED